MYKRQYFDDGFWKKETFLTNHCYGTSNVVDDDDDFDIDLDLELEDIEYDESPVHQKPKKSKAMSKRLFLDTQAMAVDDDSEDNEDDQLDGDLNDLIDDSTQMPSTQSMYMQSIRDCVGPAHHTKFKLPALAERQPDDRFESNDELDEEDEYLEDSFVNDEIVYATDSSHSPTPVKRRKHSVVTRKKRGRRVFIESP